MKLADFEIDKIDDDKYMLINFSFTNSVLINHTTFLLIKHISEIIKSNKESNLIIEKIFNKNSKTKEIYSVIKKLKVFIEDDEDINLNDNNRRILSKNIQSYDKKYKLTYNKGYTSRPLTALWTMTQSCTANCKFCYNFSSTKYRESEFDFKEKNKKILKNLLTIRPLVVCMSGGDPLIYSKTFFDIAEELKRNNVYVNTITNGVLVNKENIKKISDTFFGIQISLDGTEKTHNFLRGVKCYYKAINAIRLFEKRGKKVAINFVPTKYNINEFIKVGDMLARFNNIERFSMGRFIIADNSKASMMADYIDYKRIVEQEKGLKERWPFDVVISPYSHKPEYNSIKKMMSNGECFSSICINSNGNVEIFETMEYFKKPHYVGSLLDELSYKEIISRILNLSSIDKLKNIGFYLNPQYNF
jgi:MoaA/NifB/PqqE/SkfB family radical SAM enzyme